MDRKEMNCWSSFDRIFIGSTFRTAGDPVSMTTATLASDRVQPLKEQGSTFSAKQRRAEINESLSLSTSINRGKVKFGSLITIVFGQ
jgi:hypothetical protein